MSMAIQIMHMLAGLIVLAEALNKLERCAPMAPGLTPQQRLVDALKALAWFMLALGAGGAVAAPMLLSGGMDTSEVSDLLRLERPTLAESLAMTGVAVLVIRTRVKEG